MLGTHIDSIQEQTLKLRHLILIWLIALLTTGVMAQETETFTSEFVGSLIVQYPSDWEAYDDRSEFMIVIARGEASINSQLDPGQAALLFMTPQALEAAGLPSTSADAAFNSLLGELPADVVESEFIAEYGNGTHYQFSIPNSMSFDVVTFDRDGIPLIAIIGANEPEEGDIETLLDVIKTARYTRGAFDADSVLLSQLMIDPTYGYTYEVPASWLPFDNSSFEVVGTGDVATILLLNPESIDDISAEVNFETMIQGELELVAESMMDETEVTVVDGEDINGKPTKEVVMILDEPSEDGAIPAFEYRFVLVDYGEDQVLLSAMYSESGNSTESYIPVLRAVAESFYYAPIYPLPETLEHAGLVVPYPAGYTTDTSDDNQIVFESEDTTITVTNATQNIELYGNVASESLSTFAHAVAQELVDDDTMTVQQVTIGRDLPAHIFTNPLSDMVDTYVFITDENGGNIMLFASHEDEEIFEDVLHTIQAIANQLSVAEE